MVGIKKDGIVYMGCDSQVTLGRHSKKTLKNSNNYKIFKLDKNTLIGGVGDIRDINIVFTIENAIDELKSLKNEGGRLN